MARKRESSRCRGLKPIGSWKVLSRHARVAIGLLSAAMSRRGKVLVFGDDTRSFLATVRSLGRKGIDVHAAPFNFQAPALLSKFVRKVHRIPSYIGDGREWKRAIADLLGRENFDLLLPCDERALLPLLRHRAELGSSSIIAAPSAEAFQSFFDKIKMRDLAASLNIPVARGRAILPTDTSGAIAAEAGLPVAIKPSSSYLIEHLYSRRKVVIAHDEQMLDQVLKGLQEADYFFEAYFPGTGVGISVLAEKGGVLQAFQHRRVHEVNGASNYRVSEPVSPSMYEAVQKLIKATSYTGIAMVEFRVNPATGAWILLEVNARPWGSLPLPVALGMDFPHWWYQLLTGTYSQERRAYRAGVYARNLLPDLRYILSGFNERRRQPLKATKFLCSAAAEFSRVILGREVNDVLTMDDRAPFWGELTQNGRSAASLLGSSLQSRGMAEKDRRRLREVLEKKSDEMAIAFVCQGNICRSPFAAALTRNYKFPSPSKVSVHSYGNLPRVDAISPENALVAAAKYGVDLKDHRSQYLSFEAAGSSDVIVVFDHTNRSRIREAFPGLETPVLLLGSFSSRFPAGEEIPDPDGRDVSYFDSVYARISDGVEGLAQRMGGVRQNVRPIDS